MRKIITRSVVPNLLTLLNLFSGFTAIAYISQGEFEKGALFILVAAIFDMLDGVFARLLGATSEFGSELDSLCDVVSFGVAPAYMLYHVHFNTFGEFGIMYASFPALAGAVRLARFNVKLSSFEDKKYFHGLPIPSAALTILSYVIFVHDSIYLTELQSEIGIFFVTVITSVAMVSNIRFDNIPRPSKKSFKERPFVFIIALIGVAGSIVTKGKMVFPFMMFYIIASTIREFYLWLKERRAPEVEIDETEETETNLFDL